MDVEREDICRRLSQSHTRKKKPAALQVGHGDRCVPRSMVYPSTGDVMLCPSLRLSVPLSSNSFTGDWADIAPERLFEDLIAAHNNRLLIVVGGSRDQTTRTLVMPVLMLMLDDAASWAVMTARLCE